MWKALYFCLALSYISVTICGNSPADFLGGGDFPNGTADGVMEAQYDALYVAGATNCKFTLDPEFYYNNATNQVVLSLDRAILQAYQYGMTPFLLFEYYLDTEMLSYSKWFSIGQAYAKRYSPNSEWALANNITNFGISVFSAFDEPEKTCIVYEDYYFAILGLADGVHSVNPSLSVIPGGFTYPNTQKEFTLNGFGTALSPLWNNGTLDGIDLHIFYDIDTPIEGTYASSAQSNFDAVKQACNITRDINFYSTKWNYKRTVEGASALVTEELAAKEFLTAYWDIAGVVKSDGSGATKASFVWGLFEDDLAYGLSSSIVPSWTPLERGKTLRMVQSLAFDSEFSSQDPKGTGIYKLISSNKSQRTLVVWQNRPFWSSLAGSQFLLEVPSSEEGSWVDVYGWDGLLQTIQIPAGIANHTFSDLPTEETIMFLVYPVESEEPANNPCTPTSPTTTGQTTNSGQTTTSSFGTEEDSKIITSGARKFANSLVLNFGFFAVIYFIIYL